MAFQEQSLNCLLVVLSALMAAIAFLFPLYCAELMIVFFVPIFYASASHNCAITYKHGFLWGAVFYAFYFLDGYILIGSRGIGIARFFAIIFLYGYGVLLSGGWFFIACFISSLGDAKTYRIVGWGLTTFLYSLFIEHLYFFIFGQWEGNSLHHFVLPLAARPQWLFYIGSFGKDLCFLAILMTSIFITWTLVNKNFLQLFMYIVFVWFLFYRVELIYNPECTNDWFKKVGCIVTQTNKNDLVCAAEQIMNALHEFELQFPQCSIIIMPESIFSFPLNILQRYISLWDCQAKTIFLGAHRYEGTSLYNTLYCLKDGIIFDFYDKQHRMFFTEKIPALWSLIPSARSLFLSHNRPFTQGITKNTFIIPDIGEIKPLVCSDLFFSHKNLHLHQTYLCIVNDSWFCHGYIPYLMLLHAKVIAATKKSTIIYCAYRHCAIITTQGNCLHLSTLIT